MVNAGLKELDFHQHEFIIEAFEFAEEAVDQGKSVVPRLLLHVDTDKSRLEVLAKEGSSLRHGPFYARFDDGYLEIKGVWDGGEVVKKLADCPKS